MILEGVNVCFIHIMNLERRFLLYYKGNLNICTIWKKHTQSIEHWCYAMGGSIQNHHKKIRSVRTFETCFLGRSKIEKGVSL